MYLENSPITVDLEQQTIKHEKEGIIHCTRVSPIMTMAVP
jgi:hypothetical protein